MRDDHEKKEVLEIRKDFYRLNDHSGRAKCLQHQQRQRESRHTAYEYKKVTGEFSEKVLGAIDGL